MATEKTETINEHYTYDDYITWDDDVRYELIDGVAYALAAPNTMHQKLSGRLYLKLDSFMRGKKCDVFYAPYDVRLNYDKGDDTVVQPDLLVVCDKTKIDKKGCNGAPDLIIEIVSPSDPSRDLFQKYHKYLLAGVREYWIVDPDSKLVTLCVLDGDRYITKIYTEEDLIPSSIFDGLSINLKEIFEEL